MRVTFGQEFDFTLYSVRDKHTKLCKLEFTDKGWIFKSLVVLKRKVEIEDRVDKRLFSHLNNESSDYPKHLGDHLYFLWDNITNDELDKDEVQDALNELSEWVTSVSKNAPKHEGFKGFRF